MVFSPPTFMHALKYGRLPGFSRLAWPVSQMEGETRIETLQEANLIRKWKEEGPMG